MIAAPSPAIHEAFLKLMGRALAARQRDDGVPFALALFVTHRCMAGCPSCLWKHDDWEDVPLADLKRFLGEARDAGFVAAGISGGEPLLRRDLGDLARFIKRDLGMSILLFTTGWQLRERMDEILPWLDMLMLSLDSAVPARHDARRRLPGLHARVLESIDVVKARYPQLSIRLNACLQRGGDAEIDGLLALAEARGLALSFDFATEFRNGADGTRFTENDVAMLPEERRSTAARLLELKRSGRRILNSERYFAHFASGDGRYRCHFPKLVMSIDGRGNVEDCLDLDHPIGNIRTDRLADIMARPRFQQLRADAERCATCSSPTMIESSNIWEDPGILFGRGGLSMR